MKRILLFIGLFLLGSIAHADILDGPQSPAQSKRASGTVAYICNGSLDNTGLNAALLAAQAVGGAGGTLHISGVCSLNTSLTPTTNVTIEGDGQNSTSLQVQSSSISGINCNPALANQSFNIRRLTINYATLSSSGAAGIQCGNSSFNNTNGVIEEVTVNNATIGIICQNCINDVIFHSNITNWYSYGIELTSPLSPDSGGNVIHDNYIQSFAPASTGNTGIYWLSGGALSVHHNQIFSSLGIYLHEVLQTTEIEIDHNLFSATGTPTYGIEVDATSASFTCSTSGTVLTVSGVVGTIVPTQTAACNGIALGTIISGSGTSWVTSASTSTSGNGSSTFFMVELNITGNTFDQSAHALYIPANTGITFLYNLVFSDNTVGTLNNFTSVPNIEVYETTGAAIVGNTIRCNGACTGARPIYVDSSSSNVLVIQTPASESGAWGDPDLIGANNINPSCSGAPSGSFATVGGVVTHC